MFALDDTIVAVSSAAGPAGRSIVRLSGPQAILLAEGVFEISESAAAGSGPPAESLGQLGGFRATAGEVTVDYPLPLAAPARAYVFRAPRSYTRQDVVELHVPGEVIASAVRGVLVSVGARAAEAGEFTARAFFSGRLDLAAAEAVADIVDAEADAQLRSAVGVLEGALGRLCRPAKEALTEVLAAAEASIDFADEGIEPAPPSELAGRVRAVRGQLESALAAAGRWSPASATPRVAIAGRPNAGKSSLLNALSGTDRAIVSALAGTTRDVLSAPAGVGGGRQVMLLDAAGLACPTDPLSAAAHSAARDAVASAEAVVFVIDAADCDLTGDEALLEEVRRLNRRAPLVPLANKTDLPVDLDGLKRRFGPALLAASAATGAGLGAVRERLGKLLTGAAAPRFGQLLLHDRQRRQIASAAGAAAQAGALLESAPSVADVAELAAVDLRAALAHLAELTGEVVTEDVLTAIFSRFCVGK